MNKYEQAVALWQFYEITSTADLDKYLDSFRILFAFHSGRIEYEHRIDTGRISAGYNSSDT